MDGPTIAGHACRDLVVPEVPCRAEGERAAFDAMFLAHYPRVVDIIARVVPDRGHAEQLAADVFWKLYRKSVWKPTGANVGGWLYRAAVRVALDGLRKASRRLSHEAAAGIEQLRNGKTSAPRAPSLTRATWDPALAGSMSAAMIRAELNRSGLNRPGSSQALHLSNLRRTRAEP